MESPVEQKKTPFSHILGFATGAGAASLTMNGISSFAMVYYTKAMGLSATLAGTAFMVASFWDAIIDPYMGHLSDNTRSRYGRRHPYILVGGLLMALFFYFMWVIPAPFSQGTSLFWYVLVMNLLFRTAFAMFSIPQGALGFEICTDYHQRSTLQSTGNALNMGMNLLGVAVGWSIFFRETPGGPKATSVIANYHHMAIAFTIATVIFTFLVVSCTRRYIVDTRHIEVGHGNSFKALFKDSGEILSDKLLWRIITFMCVGGTGSIFVATVQMYLYDDMVHLTAHQKTIVHGGGMILCGGGAVVGAMLARRFDKRTTVLIGASISGFFDLLGGTIFLTRILGYDTIWMLGGIKVPISVIVFGGCDMLNWLGAGIYGTIAGSMLADLSEINDLKSGIRKDGGYSSLFAFTTKLIQSLPAFLAGWCLTVAGFVSGVEVQSPQTVRNMIFLTFGLGSFFAFMVIPIAKGYPITREIMNDVKAALAKRRALTGEAEPEPGLAAPSIGH